MDRFEEPDRHLAVGKSLDRRGRERHAQLAGDRGSQDRIARARENPEAVLPGFRSYTVIRTGPREVVAVTVFDSEAALQAALESVGDLVRERVHPLAADQPERREGRVLHHALPQAG